MSQGSRCGGFVRWFLGGVFLIVCGGIALAQVEKPESAQVDAREIQERAFVDVLVREHPRTGKPYPVIVPKGQSEARYRFQNDVKQYSRPDYRMFDPKVKPKDVGYVGPVSDRKKVYLFAASLAASGVAAGTLIPVTAATGTGAAGGAGVYGAAGAGIASGTISTATLKSTPRPDDDFEQHSHASFLEEKKQAVV